MSSMSAFEHVESLIVKALDAMKADGTLPADLAIPPIEVEFPRDPTHGDLASNAAMVLAKPARMKPRDIAEALKAKLSDTAIIDEIEVAGPGFLNLTLKPSFWQHVVRAIDKQGEQYGRAAPGSSLLAFAGYEVTREYYINDAGTQVDVLARSTYLRYREALGEDIGQIPEGLYPGGYLKPVGEALAKEFGDKLLGCDEVDWLPIVREKAIVAMLAMIKEDLAALNIHHDVFFSEASLKQNGRDRVAEAIEALRSKGLIYKGQLPRPKGHDEDEWEEREQVLFKSTDFGDDIDRALQKSDGSYTYFAADIAYHYDKLERGFKHLVNVFGADHVGYIPRMKAAVAALSGGEADLDIKVCQLVKLYKNGEPYKMSKRAGTFVTLRDVVEEVGRDPVRFMMLYRKNDAPLDFDFAKVTEQSKDNPVFYVQYAHARAASLFRNAAEAFPGLTSDSAEVRDADLSKLDNSGEIDLMKRLAAFPRIMTGAANAHEPHRLAFYLFELASALHAQWSRGNDSPHLRFIQQDDRDLTAARLALVAAMQRVISSGLAVLGVEAPDAMR
jgi:arginyl-tRNA synthetase